VIDPRDFGRLEGKVDQILDLVKELEPRVRKVEQRQHWYAGAGSVIGLIAGIFVKGHVA
jgi:hypothetical protein